MWQSVSPCSSAKREAAPKANSQPSTNLPKPQPTCQVSLRGCGLPRRFAPRNDSGEVSSRPVPSLPCTAATQQVSTHPTRPTALHPLTRRYLLHVIANQCAHWCGNPFSPQRSLASWYCFGQIRSTFPYSPEVPLSVMPCRKENGLPRRFAPRNDSGEVSSRPGPSLPCTRCHAASFHAPDAPHGLAPADTPPPSACHCKTRPCTRSHAATFCMSLRTSAHTGAAIRSPRRGAWQVGTASGKSVALFRIRPKYRFLLCPAARRTDCHVASLLAMTGKSLRRVTHHCATRQRTEARRTGKAPR